MHVKQPVLCSVFKNHMKTALPHFLNTFHFVLTALNTSGPSSKSTMAKNSLLEYCWEYLHELARIKYSLLASLHKEIID